MIDTKERKLAESLFDRTRRREAEIGEALKKEQERHAAAVKNMYRLRALRLSRAEQESRSEGRSAVGRAFSSAVNGREIGR